MPRQRRRRFKKNCNNKTHNEHGAPTSSSSSSFSVCLCEKFAANVVWMKIRSLNEKEAWKGSRNFEGEKNIMKIKFEKDHNVKSLINIFSGVKSNNIKVVVEWVFWWHECNRKLMMKAAAQAVCWNNNFKPYSTMKCFVCVCVCNGRRKVILRIFDFNNFSLLVRGSFNYFKQQLKMAWENHNPDFDSLNEL